MNDLKHKYFYLLYHLLTTKPSDSHLYFLIGGYTRWLRNKLYLKKFVLTRNTAIDIPTRKPAITSDQWFRYSATLLSPVRKAKHIKPRHRTGLASLVPLALIVLVMYIWNSKWKTWLSMNVFPWYTPHICVCTYIYLLT